MFKSLLFAGVATVLTVLPALAENWILVGRSKSGTDYYIDTESVQGNNRTYLFWWMSVNAEPDEKGIVAEKTYVSMNCPLRGFRVLTYAQFNAQGELINRAETDENEPLQFFAADSIGERLWKFVCE